MLPRRDFLRQALAGTGALIAPALVLGQVSGERPPPATGCAVLNPRNRVPVSIIIDDSTCLVNLNRFAMPQFNDTFDGANRVYQRNWREWPVEIPDAFIREFSDWATEAGVKGKFSIVPFPACVGRLDRGLPGWSQQQLKDSLELVRTGMMPRWDIHPEMITHTRVIDLSTGQPYQDFSPRFMENWEWTTGRSVDEIAAYIAYALRILRDVGLPCEGITTPGGFGNRALPQLAQASGEALRDVFKAEIPHYFRHLIDQGSEPVTPRVEYAQNLSGADPRCVVSMIACTGDWTGGWDCTEPAGADKFITADGKGGRLVEVIERGEPALLLAHWTGVYWNGRKLGLEIFREVVRRLHARFDNLEWMKLSEIARYWAARELTQIAVQPNGVQFTAPYSCPGFTVKVNTPNSRPPVVTSGPAGTIQRLQAVFRPGELKSGTWHQVNDGIMASFDLPRGLTMLRWD
ncbi:MAG TPA: hypothetical protein PLX89_01700 [Verrucomicrobiota bacterium]|nr:hypothetical protein [Verrucomicrobiales bacterium]HRI11691.1 hypothetical protein [Verrucomicrobiota bacterium]